MKFKVNKSKCAGCGACLQTCPYGAIKIGKDGKAFIDQNKCKKCGECQKICPFDAIEEISKERNIEQFPSESRPADERDLGTGGGRGIGTGRGRGLGRGPRDGRGEGRGGGGGGRG